MSLHTKKRLTDYEELSFAGPPEIVKKAREYLKEMGLIEITELVDSKDVFPERSPSRMLSGARYREGLTQAELSSITGIPRRHISEMENGKRTAKEPSER